MSLTSSTSSSEAPDLDEGCAIVLEALVEKWTAEDEAAVAELLDPAKDEELEALEAAAIGAEAKWEAACEAFDIGVEKLTAWQADEYGFAPKETTLAESVAEELAGWDAEIDAELDAADDPDGLTEDPSDTTGWIEEAKDTMIEAVVNLTPAETLEAGFLVDDVAVAMNDAEMPEPDAMAQILAEMQAMKAQIAQLDSKNAELEARLSTNEQLELNLGV